MAKNPKDTVCPHCGRKFRGAYGLEVHIAAMHDDPNRLRPSDPKRERKLNPNFDGQGRRDPREPLDPNSSTPRWDYDCIVCGQSPVLPLTEMCGPCTFGEADTIGGNW